MGINYRIPSESLKSLKKGDMTLNYYISSASKEILGVRDSQLTQVLGKFGDQMIFGVT